MVDSSVTKIRLSLGSAIVLGLRQARMDVRPTTLYTMLGERCLGACRFCAQARDSHADPKFLSRIVWPKFDLDAVIGRLSSADGVRRICIQTLRYPGMPADLVSTVRRIHQASELPISVCVNPMASRWLPELKAAGVERMGIGLDCATQDTFQRIKPGFHWDWYHRFLDQVTETFGTVSIHLIVGLGDSDEALVRKIQEVYDRAGYIALFAFTPVRGAQLDLPAPDIGRYRALQLAHYLIAKGQARLEDMTFVGGKLVAIGADEAAISDALASGEPFRTSGCPDCNRPLYNERPGGAMYNYAKPLSETEKAMAVNELCTYLKLRSKFVTAAAKEGRKV